MRATEYTENAWQLADPGWKKSAHEVVWEEIQAVYEESGMSMSALEMSVVRVRGDVLGVDNPSFLPGGFLCSYFRETRHLKEKEMREADALKLPLLVGARILKLTKNTKQSTSRSNACMESKFNAGATLLLPVPFFATIVNG